MKTYQEPFCEVLYIEGIDIVTGSQDTEGDVDD
jgi:hypothetical protein